MPDHKKKLDATKIGVEKAAFALVLIALLACLAAYAVALDGPLFFDDVPNLLDNQLVQIGGEHFDDWRVAATSSNSGLFLRPVAMLTFALNHAWVGSFTAVSLKGTNLAIHCLNGALIFLLTRTLLQSPALGALQPEDSRRRLIAVAAAVIWLLHPIHVSTVLYAVQRMAQLSALFTLAGLLVYCRYRLRWAAGGGSAGEIIAASLWLGLLGLCGVLSKENGALLPWLIAVTEVTLFQGVWRGAPRKALVRLGWLCLLLPVLCVMVVALFSPEFLTAPFGGREFTLQERLLTQARVLWRYIGWLLIPNILDMGFFHDDIPISQSLFAPLTTALSLLGWGLVVAAALVGHRRYPLFAFAVLFFLVGHSMESSVLPLEMVFEHRNYLPSVGLFILLATGILRVADRLGGLHAPGMITVVLLALAGLLAVRTHTWSDDMTLARFNVINHPQSPRANFYYANAMFDRFQQAQALGLPEEEKQALAVTARRYYERMHSMDERDFAALVMLYQLDSRHFPALAEQNDWLGKMDTLARTRRLQSSDYTALSSLVDFVSSGAPESEMLRVAALVDRLSARLPGKLQLVGYQYRLLKAAGNEGAESLGVSLERVAQINPQSRQAAAYLAQYHSTDDLAASYEAIREWMRRDPLRRELPLIREIFDN